jgi:hypothetical protein
MGGGARKPGHSRSGIQAGAGSGGPALKQRATDNHFRFKPEQKRKREKMKRSVKEAIELLEDALETMIYETKTPEYYQEVDYIREAINILEEYQLFSVKPDSGNYAGA